ncbi:MAG: YitT family protein [Candidatus Marinimicrobia bacterium]|nr:YitT family protein [Candidatus Neomarinimicrobiota bacterium]MDD4961121.1 YitT family protein [Candidatus Neomarinimicrobiota bacterium]
MDYITIVLGSLIMASALMFFLIPNKISAGGISGISTIFYHIFGWKAGISMLAMNIPLFIIGIRIFGKKFGLKTLWGIFWISIFTDLIDVVIDIPPATHEPMLAAIYGGLLLGIGLGIIMKGRGTTGGSDIIARVMNKYLHISLGNSFIVIDTVIIISVGIVFGNVDLILFCLISLVISSKIVDIIIEGNPSEKAITIISMNGEQIAGRIINEVKRGVTANISRGLYTNREKMTLYCVVATRQIEQIRRIVKQEDPSAFVTVTNVSIMQGEGFRAQTTLNED